MVVAALQVRVRPTFIFLSFYYPSLLERLGQASFQLVATIQSTTNLNREFYVRPPQELQNELGLDEDSVLKVLKPLYGVLEAGNHWFKTYHSHYVQQLHMDQSTYNPCLLQSNEPFSIVGLQTNDTLSLVDEIFAEVEQNKLHKAKFMAKEREQLTVDTPLKFNGGLIQLVLDGITLT